MSWNVPGTGRPSFTAAPVLALFHYVLNVFLFIRPPEGDGKTKPVAD